MNSNPYVKSSFGFFKESASHIKNEMSHDAVIQATLNFAIGMERLLKGIIFEINPTYVLVSPEFNHSLKVLYKDKIIEGDDSKSLLAKAPIADVITFRNSLLRAAVVSAATQKNKNRLFGLSNLRDIIAHHDLSLLDIPKATLLLKRDFYFILLDFVDEIKISKASCFGRYEEDLIDLSRGLQEDIKNIVRLKLEGHRRIWGKIKNNTEIVGHRAAVTDELLESRFRYEIPCPACNQRAVIFLEPELLIDADDTGKNAAGEFVQLIRCEFCEIQIEDDAELDEIGYGKFFNSNMDADIPF